MTTAKTKSWALRLPMNLQLKDLDGCTFDSDEKCLVIHGVSYQLVPSSSTTESAVCALEPQKKRDDDSSGSDDGDDDDESSSGSSGKKKKKKGEQQKNKKKKEAKTVTLVATPTESYSLVETNLDASDAMLRTTSIDTSTVPDTILRKAYRHVPQVAGLKRRWMPMGNRIGNWQPRPVNVSNQDDVADAAAGAVPHQREHYPVDIIQPEIKAEPRDEPNEAVAGKKRDRSSCTSKKVKKDKSAKKTKRKKTT
jgi:hypothetical protein